MKTLTPSASPKDDRDPSQQLDRTVVRQGVGRVSSEKLLGALRELEIEHGTELYRLRVTSIGKLILTK
jgi:hemin uptake protein HemP